MTVRNKLREIFNLHISFPHLHPLFPQIQAHSLLSPASPFSSHCKHILFYQRGLTYILPVYSFSPTTPTRRGCTQLPLARYRPRCILKNGKGNERHLHCLRFSRSSRQVDGERINRQLSDLYVVIKSLALST